jgi:hypothetical protein
MVTLLLLSFRIEAMVSSAAHSSKPREYRFGGAGRQDTTALPAAGAHLLDRAVERSAGVVGERGLRERGRRVRHFHDLRQHLHQKVVALFAAFVGVAVALEQGASVLYVLTTA